MSIGKPSRVVREPGPAGDPDAPLRTALQDALSRSPGQGLQDLQDRVMAQWNLRAATPVPVAGGAGAVLHVALHSVRVQFALLALIMVAVLGWQSLHNRVEPSLDDLLEPDVLSLMALGEL